MTDSQDLIREIQEHTSAHGGENTSTHLLVQAALALQRQADELAAIGAGGVSGPLMGQPQAMPDLTALTERGAKAWAGVDAQRLREGRWYMVTHDGVATLCEDRRDAEKEAKDADMAWPHSGPHRAVQLVEASTAGFTAADMATAAAQGFRDGVASVAANAPAPSAHIKEPYTPAEIKNKIASNDYSAELLLQHAMLLLDSASLAASAGSEPVAWVDERALAWLANSRSLSATITTKLEKGKSFERPTPLYDHPSSPEGTVGGWTKASQQLPPCRDDQLYLGVNTAGFAGVFNAVAKIAGDVYCMYETPEETIDVMSSLDIWQPFTPPTASAGSGKGE